MRFDARAVSLATYFAILLFNVYTLVLYFNQQLALYTNPRYVWFTAIFNAISAVACAVGIILTAWRMGKGSIGGLAVPWRPSFTLLVAIIRFWLQYGRRESVPAQELRWPVKSCNVSCTQFQQPSACRWEIIGSQLQNPGLTHSESRTVMSMRSQSWSSQSTRQGVL